MEKDATGEAAAAETRVTFFVVECMEFHRYGEYTDGITSLREALEYYDQIPADRLNAGKGIGIHLDDPQEYGIKLEYPLLMGNVLDIDLLDSIHAFSQYPQILVIAKDLAELREDITVTDSQKLLSRQEIAVDAETLAKRINALQQKIDPDFYSQLYPDGTVQEKKITMKLLTREGAEEYLQWMDTGKLVLGRELQEEAEEIYRLLEQSKIRWPVVISPFVQIKCTESHVLENGDVIPIEEADSLFGELDREKAEVNRETGKNSYDKTQFVIYYQMGGKVFTYEGWQDFGDGDGTLLEHIEGFAKLYLESEEGKTLLRKMNEQHRQQFQGECHYILDEFLPYLMYYCNLSKIEKALLEEQKAEEKIPVLTDRQEARKEYQKDLMAYIEESKRVLNQGGELPAMPDIKEYEETKEKKAYREHVMAEIEHEAEAVGMTVEEYAKNGYEPIIKTR